MLRRRSPPTSLRETDLRNPSTLARTFDETAPGLLRFAIHLVGDAAVAEDLVQETFLAALESADRYDPSKPVRPWLQGILVMRVRRRAREDQRKPDLDRLLAQAERSGDEESIDPERAAVLTEAIDKLDEPYREVLLLRARHGLSPADIAHVLERSPGAVRVQLHRGIEKLKRALPAGMAVFALLALSPSRGLAAVKSAVVEHATAQLVLGAGAGVGITTELIMGKVMLGVGAALVVVALALWRPWEALENAPPPVPDMVLEPLGIEGEAPDVPVKLATAPKSTEAVEPTLAPITTETYAFTGRVVDAANADAGVEGATLRFFPTQRTTLEALNAEYTDLIEQYPEGGIRFLGPTPVAIPPFTPGQQLGLEPMDAYLAPTDTSKPLAAARSGTNGAFTLQTPAVPGLLVVRKPGYGVRQIATCGEASGTLIKLHPSRHVLVQLVTSEGDPFPKPLRLVLAGDSTTLPLGVAKDVAHTDKTWTANAIERVRSEPGGRLSARIAAEWVFLHCGTPGYRLEWEHKTGSRNPSVASARTHATLHDAEPKRIVVTPVTTLHVTSAKTGDPIPVVSLHGRDSANGFLSFAGRFTTHDGYHTLLDNNVMWQRAKGTNIALHVWADGFEPTVIRVPDLRAAGLIEIALAPGEAPSLGVRVLDDSKPVFNASVSLATYRTIAWTGTETSYVAVARTDGSGDAQLRAAEGAYLLTVSHGKQVYRRVVTLLQDTGLEIDLEHLPGIDVRVLDPNGRPLDDYAVGLNATHGQSTRAYTNKEGWARFDRLVPGDYKIFIPRHTTKGSFGGDQTKPVTLQPSGREQVVFHRRADRNVTVRIHADNPDVDLTGWRARVSQPRPETQWTQLKADGQVPVALGSATRLEIETSKGRRYDVLIPETQDGELDVRIPTQGPRYVGRIVSPSGQPRRGLRVIGLPGSKDEWSIRNTWPSAVTDAEGRFELVCSAPVVHKLTFSRQPRFSRQPNNWTMHGTLNSFFEPTTAAAHDPTEIEIVLPSDARPTTFVQVRGVLRDQAGTAIPKTLLAWSVVLESEHGTLRHTPNGAFVYTDEKGGFEANLPQTPKIRVSVSREADEGRESHAETWDIEPGTEVVTRDIVIPAR